MTGRVRPARWATAHPALALFLFTVTLYALTAGASRNSFGYSADGTFAFEMAKSAVVDPGHAYLRDQNRNFSRWGVGLPLAMVPNAFLEGKYCPHEPSAPPAVPPLLLLEGVMEFRILLYL